MVAAFIGLVGVVFLLVIGQNGFWSARRDELAETVVTLAILQEEVRRDHDKGGRQSGAALQAAWQERRKWLAIHVSPDDYRILAASIMREPSAVFDQCDLAGRLGALYDLFWEEHEAFFLVPLVHWAKGNTVSKRARAILDPATAVDDRRTASAIRSWHSPDPVERKTDAESSRVTPDDLSR